MAIKTKDGKFTCSFCGKIYSQLHEAETCKEKHNLIYFPLTSKELSAILQFMFTKDDDLLSEPLVRRLQKYSRARAIPLDK